MRAHGVGRSLSLEPDGKEALGGNGVTERRRHERGVLGLLRERKEGGSTSERESTLAAIKRKRKKEIPSAFLLQK